MRINLTTPNVLLEHLLKEGKIFPGFMAFDVEPPILNVHLIKQ